MTIPWYVVIIILVCSFYIFGLLVAWTQAKTWRKIASKYPISNRRIDCKWYFRRLQIADIESRLILITGANKDGAYFSACVPFSYILPPFFVPWSEIQGFEHRLALRQVVELRFAQAKGYRSIVIVSKRIALKFSAASNNTWTFDRSFKRTLW
jgi:hypothetical protein